MAKVYFYQRLNDKQIFPCEAAEAHHNRNKSGLKYVGCSDGKAFEKVMQELPNAIMKHKKEVELSKRRCDAIESEINRLLVTDTPQEKINALQVTLDKLIDALMLKQDEMVSVENVLREKALQAEIAVAKKNKKEFPPDDSWSFPFGDVEKTKAAINQKGYGQPR